MPPRVLHKPLMPPPLHEKPYDPYRQAHENKRSHVTFERDGHDSPRNDNRVAKAIIAVGSWVTRGFVWIAWRGPACS